MIKQFIVSGVELGGYVIDWADLEESKELLLAKATLFTGELSLRLSNAKGQFSTNKTGSLFKGRSTYNIPCTITLDGVTAFSGVLKDVREDSATRTATFVMENLLSKPSESQVVLNQVGANPVAAALAVFDAVDLGGLVHRPSFFAAMGPSLAAGAVISLELLDGQNNSVLSVIQRISDLCSVSFFVSGGFIRAKAFKPYQGSEAGLGPELGPSLAREFGELRRAYESFANQVTVNYGADGNSFTRTDAISVGRNGVTRPYQFNTATGQQLSVPDAASAEFFGSLFLQRASEPPLVGTVITGPEFMSVSIGDRLPVTAPRWGLVRAPFEIIETQKQTQTLSATLTLRGV